MPKLALFAGAFALLLMTPGASTASASAPFPVVDLHVDLSYQYNFKNKDFASNTGQFSTRALQRGGVAGVVLPLFVPRAGKPT